ncbi:hypothetical protein GCM10028818_02120 [Spirosoma horti]
MLHVYANANTYQDKGRVQTFFYDLNQKTPTFLTVRNFTTAYNRQIDAFRFWYKTEKATAANVHEEMVIWSRKNDGHLWWTINKSGDQRMPLIEALGVATGVSGTASRKIPGLLLSQSIGAGWSIDSLKNVKLIGKDVQGNRPCYRLTGIFWKNRVAFLWVDQQTFLLLRVDEGHSMSKSKWKTSITYQAVVNKPIPENALAFDPPRSQ